MSVNISRPDLGQIMNDLSYIRGHILARNPYLVFFFIFYQISRGSLIDCDVLV